MFTSFYYDWTLAEAAENAAFPAKFLSNTKPWRCIKHHKTPADKTSLTGVGMNLDQVKKYFSMFTSFYYDWTLAEAAKNAAFPATLLSSTKLWRCNNHHETPADKPSLTGVGMNLGPVKYAYPCLPAFIMTEHWLKQPKLLALLPPCCWVKNMKMQQTPQNSFK